MCALLSVWVRMCMCVCVRVVGELRGTMLSLSTSISCELTLSSTKTIKISVFDLRFIFVG